MLILAIASVLAAGVAVLLVLARRFNRSTARAREDAAARIEAAQGERRGREAILAALDEGIVLFGADGAVVYRNPRADRLLRHPPSSAAHLAPSELRALVEAALAGEGPPPIEVGSGTDGPILGAAAARMPDGQALLVLRDVTQARRLEAVRRDFVANASHELKTPVASIQALAETMRDSWEEDPGAIPVFAEQLRGEVDRLGRIVSDLLDLSRLEGGPGRIEPVRLDLIARDEAERMGDRARGAHLALEVATPEALLVAGSERDLRLLVRNLIENALQYTGSKGRVEVATGSEDGQAVLRVSDTGIGIPARERDRVFERFYRVDRARSRDTGGTGLGLSIVRHVAENHGGTVTVDSQLGRGSTFTLRLPLAAS
jgi:two-component system, OmpR family, sensor histidine kinase SenX3